MRVFFRSHIGARQSRCRLLLAARAQDAGRSASYEGKKQGDISIRPSISTLAVGAISFMARIMPPTFLCLV
jgi:hypothetical protein